MDRMKANGYVEAGFEPVKDAFEQNFNKKENGAACAIYYQGRKVVDLWGGLAEPRLNKCWEKDTLVPVFSSTKGFAALAVAVAHSKGWIDYDAKISSYWAEFGTNGKENITIRQLLAHQAGLCTLTQLQLDKISDLDTSHIAPQLADLKPEWNPGSIHAYHTWTIGWFIGEIMRRADPKGRTLGKFFHEEVAQPLHAEFFIGLPDYIPQSRLAAVQGMHSPFQLLFHLHEIPKPLLIGFLNPRSLTSRSMVDRNKLVAHENFNKREMLSIELPSGNGVGDARSMAKIYSEFATGGKALNLSKDTLIEIMKPANPPFNGWYDHVNRCEVGYSLGFWKPISGRMFGSSTHSFGHPGAGGSFCFADPDRAVGYAYVLNKIGGYMDGNPRENEVRKAFYQCITN
ncbi:esterase [Paenibacillus montaniterrae]|uniref:Esterase n=2 Tax=Paenibacillus montaniterrae TaxID=429341 RepID=A0A920CXW6_9BACL|nr:esterase [Paenibacillus montaniterrae]